MSSPTTIKNLSLYHFDTCPFCVMTRQAIKHLGLRIKLKDIYTNPKLRKELITGGGKSQVPCLKIETSDGKVRWLYESGDIIHYMKKYQKSISSAA